MKIIGLTGGIGSGKSTVSNYLSQKGYPIIDADKIAKKIVEPNSVILFELARCFGEEILNQDGSLNRKVLADITFFNKVQKEKLDNIMLKEIVRIILKQIDSYNKKGENLVFIDAPLLFETGLDKKSDETWVVDASDEIRIQRVIKRDNTTWKDVKARVINQMSREEKNKKASYVLNNSTTQEELYRQIDKILKY